MTFPNITTSPSHPQPPPLPQGKGAESDVHQRQPNGIGFFLIFLVASAFFAANSAQLQAMGSSVRRAQQQAEDAKKPAEVSAISIVTQSCPACYKVANIVNGIGASDKVKVLSSTTVDYASADGAALLKQYGIVRAPAIIIRGQTEKLMTEFPALKTYGTVQENEFVGTNLPAPYVEVPSGKIRGEFQATYVTEKQCKECYDPAKLDRQALFQLGMVPAMETTVDRTDTAGQKLVAQYQLATTPTVILNGDLAAYEGFDKIWQGVGTIEKDGAYVFRSGQDRMGTYWDIAGKKVVVPPQPAAGSGAPTTP